jgi:hypothetical protein
MPSGKPLHATKGGPVGTNGLGGHMKCEFNSALCWSVNLADRQLFPTLRLSSPRKSLIIRSAVNNATICAITSLLGRAFK